MKIMSRRKARVVYASREVVSKNDDGTDKHEFYLSLHAQVEHGRRPIGRFDSQQELELAAISRNCKIQWQE